MQATKDDQPLHCDLDGPAVTDVRISASLGLTGLRGGGLVALWVGQGLHLCADTRRFTPGSLPGLALQPSSLSLVRLLITQRLQPYTIHCGLEGEAAGSQRKLWLLSFLFPLAQF